MIEPKMIKVIDILNAFAEGGSVPEHVMYNDYLYEFKEKAQDYYSYTLDKWLFGFTFGNDFVKRLNEELEIVPYVL